MRSERRGTRNRVYMLVSAFLMLAIFVVALGSLSALSRQALSEVHYPYPDRVIVALAAAQERFRLHDLDEDKTLDYAASLAELEESGQITRTLATGTVHGYRYDLKSTGGNFEITATPDVALVGTAALHYRVDRTQVVRAEVGQPATAKSEVF